MAEFRLHERSQANLLAVARLDEAAVEQLLAKLPSMLPSFLSDDFAEDLAKLLPLWTKASINQVLPTLAGLCLMRTKVAQPVESFVNSVVDAARKGSSGTDKQLSEAEEKVLRERLVSFLKLQSLDISAKAYDVLTSHQRAFLECRIFTDVRSIFGDDVAQGPAAAVIVHKLKFEYRQDTQTRDVYFALDSKDLKVLADVVKRAQDKDEALRKKLLGANIPFIEPR
jgi:hypothetical protein